MSKSPHVLIVGAGLAGLALAQTLRAKGVSYDLFERDPTEVARSQGWGITLAADILDSFENELPDDMPNIEIVNQLYGTGITTDGAIYHASTNLLKQLRRLGPEHGRQHSLRANRGKLRRWLMTEIDVLWAKKFSHYEQDSTGVTAFFEDGSMYGGSVLVGADGINSIVRKQLLPETRPQCLPMGAILGELEATKDQYERWMGLGVSWFSAFADDLRVTILLSSVSPQLGKADYYWVFGWHDEAARQENYWTSTATKEELHQHILANLGKLHPSIAEVFHATPVEGILLSGYRLRDMLPPVLPDGPVTLIGDAVRSMTPFRGQGGNMAMADGISLAHCLLGASERGEHLELALKQYEMEMRPRSIRAVLESRGGTREENARPASETKA